MLLRHFIPMLGLSQERGPKRDIQYLMFEVPKSAEHEHLEEAQLRIYAMVHKHNRGPYGTNKVIIKYSKLFN